MLLEEYESVKAHAAVRVSVSSGVRRWLDKPGCVRVGKCEAVQIAQIVRR